jgi:hypothetical protein
MLALPEYGVRPSAAAHNCDPDVVTDWVEASVLFVDDFVSKSDVADILVENTIYRDQDFAREFIENIWYVLRRRERDLGASAPFRVSGERIQRSLHWKDVAAHAFCLVVTLRPHLSKWNKALDGKYGEQGGLFEQLTAESLTQLGWDVYRTGWNELNDKNDFERVVSDISDRIFDPSTPQNIHKNANDTGLDLVCHLTFSDGRGGHPVFLVQCASGQNWEKKLRTPSLSIWRRLIDFSGTHNLGFAVPIGFARDEEFRRMRISSEGLFWDRYRLLAAGRAKRDWISPKLHDDLVKWVEMAIAAN